MQSTAKSSQSPANGDDMFFENNAGGTSGYGGGIVTTGNATVSKNGNTVTITIPETIYCLGRGEAGGYKNGEMTSTYVKSHDSTKVTARSIKVTLNIS